MQLKIPAFDELLSDIVQNQAEWRKLCQNEDLGSAIIFNAIPHRWASRLPLFPQLLLIKLFIPQQLNHGITDYVEFTLGKTYSVSPHTSMHDLFDASDKTSPIIFVLS